MDNMWTRQDTRMNESCVHNRFFFFGITTIVDLLHKFICYEWVSHVTHMNASCQIRIGTIHAYNRFGKFYSLQFVTHSLPSCHTYECVMSHIWEHYVAHMNASWRTYECVMSHVWMRHVTHMNASWHAYEWVMSHIWMRHVTHMNASCHTYECITSHIWMHHVTHMNASCHTY